ncbi:unnamed protein product [Scytosiphon promiscuus]
MYHRGNRDTASMATSRKRSVDAVTSGFPCRETTLDLAEELFVSCRFTEASRVCSTALSSGSNTLLANGGTVSNTRSSRSDTAGPALVVAFDDQFIDPVAECDTSDLFVAVLLQCGFELQRAEEWDRCRAFYSANGDAMPFAVAILWLRLRLAGGEFELVRRVLRQLRAALANELQRRTSATTVDTGGTTDLENYSEATEMLVLQVMLPCGESAEASELVSNDAHLGPQERGQLLRACEASALHSQGERRTGQTAGGGTARDARSPASTGDGTSPPGARERMAASGDRRRDGDTTVGISDRPIDAGATQHGPHQQGTVQKLISCVSDWTPEARLQLVVGAGAAGLAAYATLRNRDSLWRTARSAVGVAVRTARDVGGFIVGSS